MFNPIFKTVSISDFQKRSKQIFDEVANLEEPTIIMNRNKPVSIIMNTEVYEKMIEDFEDLRDAMLSQRDEKSYKDEDYLNWSEIKKEIKDLREGNV